MADDIYDEFVDKDPEPYWRPLGCGCIDPDSQEGRDLRNVHRQLKPAVEVDAVTRTIVWPDGRVE
jgi:hypothetical protein